MQLKPALAAAALTPALLALPAAVPGAVAAPHHPAVVAKHKHNRCNYPPSHTTLTLSVSRSQVPSGHRVVVFGALFNHRCTVKHARVVIFGNGDKLVTVRTDGHGGYHVIFHPKRTTTYRSEFAGNKYASHAESNRVTVTVTPTKHHRHH